MVLGPDDDVAIAVAVAAAAAALDIAASGRGVAREAVGEDALVRGGVMDGAAAAAHDGGVAVVAVAAAVGVVDAAAVAVGVEYGGAWMFRSLKI